MKQQSQNERKKWKEHEWRGGVEQEEWKESEKGGPQVRDQNNVQVSLVPSMHKRAKDPKRFEQHEHRPELAIPVCTNRAFDYNDQRSFLSQRGAPGSHHGEETIDKSRFGTISYRRKHRSALHRVYITSETDA